jgi:hypothetical protein
MKPGCSAERLQMVAGEHDCAWRTSSRPHTAQNKQRCNTANGGQDGTVTSKFVGTGPMNCRFVSWRWGSMLAIKDPDIVINAHSYYGALQVLNKWKHPGPILMWRVLLCLGHDAVHPPCSRALSTPLFWVRQTCQRHSSTMVPVTVPCGEDPSAGAQIRCQLHCS